MKGSVHIRIWNRAVSYDFTLHRNITVLQGNSATGKTTLIEMVNEYMLRGEDSAIHLSCSVPCTVINGNTWIKQLEMLECDSIVFIDEGNSFVSSKEFAKAIQGTGHYYVIATREPLYELPYSVNEIYGIHSSGKYNSLEPVYHEFYRIYTDNLSKQNLNEVQTVLTEDSGSGFQFFSAIGKNVVSCRTSYGNSGILQYLRTAEKNESILVIADGSAFGAFMAQVSIYSEKSGNIILYLPESFEWFILSSGLIDGNRIKGILQKPEDHIESRNYFSWEQYFTDLIIKETSGTYLQYWKTDLNPAYLHPHEKELLVQALPQMIRILFAED